MNTEIEERNENKIVIVKKARPKINPNIGEITPIAYYYQDVDEYASIKPEDFPNSGRIFISQNYEIIAEKYKENEFFCISAIDIKSRDDFSVEETGKAKYWAFGNKTFRLDDNLLVPVVPLPLPSKKDGLLENVNYFPILSNNKVFILNENFIYGPFKIHNDDDLFYALCIDTPSHLDLHKNWVAKYQLDEINTSLINLSGGQYIKNFKQLPKPSEDEREDFTTDEQLISYFKNEKFGQRSSPLSRKEAQKLIDAIKQFNRNIRVNNNPRLERLTNILDDFINQSGYKDNIINAYFDDTKEGKKYLDNYLKDNINQIIENRSEEIEKKVEEKRRLLENKYVDKQLLLQKEFDDKKNKFNLEIKEFEERLEKIKQDTTQEEINKEKEQLNEEIIQSRKKLDELKDEISEYGQIADLKEKQISLRGGIDTLEETLENKRKQLEEVKSAVDYQKQLIENNKHLRERAIEIQTLQDLMSLKTQKEEKDIINDKNTFEIKHCNDELLNEATKIGYIGYLTDKFNKIDSGCQLSILEMANIILSLSQSFLTVFSGLPGTGKTSTVKKLAVSLGLMDCIDSKLSSENFLNISVGRGWVSSRDLLGFYNPLKENYQISRTGLYTYLMQNNDYLKLVLLDEANLSSIEHYWSDFVQMCDNTGNIRGKIDTGNPSLKDKYLTIGNNVRFIATINNDATTEKLSPRLVDRASIICFNNIMNNDTYSDELSSRSNEFYGAIKSEYFIHQFTADLNDMDEWNDSEQANIFNEIRTVLSEPSEGNGLRIPISPRKKNSIEQYCSVANNLNGIYNNNQAIDFAIAQHILPLIEGFGVDFKKRLEKLKKILEDYSMSRSLKLLEEIIVNGEYNSDSYSFF